MGRDELLGLLREHRATLVQRFGVAELFLFGSFARDQATDDSDIDLLVQFGGLATLRQLGHYPDRHSDPSAGAERSLELR